MSSTNVGGGFTKMCKVALAQSTGLPPHTSYTILIGPTKPAAAVNEYVPSLLNVNVPCTVVGPFTKVAVRFPPPAFWSFNNTVPLTVLAPVELAIVEI